MALPLDNQPTTAEVVWKKLPWSLPAPRRVEYRDLNGQVIKAEDISGESPTVSVSIVPPAVDCWILTAR